VLRLLKTGHPMSRFGFTAASTLGNAVVRNRIKRRLREAVRSLPVVPGWDIVINSRRGAAEASYDQLRAQLSELMTRARLLQETPG